MGTEGETRLPSDANVREWTPSQRALMSQLDLVDRKPRRQKRNGRWVEVPQADAPAGVIEAFLQQCDRTGLDPFARQIYAAEMGGKWTVLISIDGFRLIADRTGKYVGKKPTLWCGPDEVWHKVWLSPEPPAAAMVSVLRSDFAEGVVAVATYEGYVPRDYEGNPRPSGQWGHNASNQLAKCAEMLALRQAFPNELSGLYGTEEMDQARGGRAPAALQRQSAPAVQSGPRKLTDDEWDEWSDVLADIDSRESGKSAQQTAIDRHVFLALAPDGRTLKEHFADAAAALAKREKAEAAEVVTEPEPAAAPAEPAPAAVPVEPIPADGKWPEEAEPNADPATGEVLI